MLPYTPLHHLLMLAVGDVPLVMTSGNRTDEPICFKDADARNRLAGIVDLFLAHNRPIRVRCEDSVMRSVGGREFPVRRSRGYAPESVALPHECPVPILAVGGQLKSVFALGRGRHAFLSHHLGDLDHPDAYRAFVGDIDLYEKLFSICPELIVHDLHPDYASTRYAIKRSSIRNPMEADTSNGSRLLGVQHHHAHMASCMAENGIQEPVIGVTFDGSGYGTDGAVWGGEFLIGDYRGFRRAARFRYIGLPGGEQAVREPWRMALAHLLDAGLGDALLQGRIPVRAIRTVRAMLERRLNTPLTSSVGRLFDAVASLIGVRDMVTYEGQAAMELEWRASGVCKNAAYPFDLEELTGDNAPQTPFVVDARPMIQAIVHDIARGTALPLIARRFHSTMADAVVAVCERLRSLTGLNVVVLSGGVFMNALLTQESVNELKRRDFLVHTHRLVPSNDGGLSLGQLAIAGKSLG
jgi:hydrogenase maturation protein HypF